MYDLAAVGESLIDFTPCGQNERGIELFAQNPGGSVANVLAMCAKLGRSTAFIGKLGRDAFGRYLHGVMSGAGIDCSGVVFSDRYPTTLAFVQLSPSGDRSFSFYRDPGADIMLTPDELDDGILTGCRILHFGGVSLTGEPARSATLEAVRRARAAGALISYDPNYRAPLWSGEEEARRVLRAALPMADFIKVSGDELHLLTDERDPAAGARRLAACGARLAVVTLGAEGACYNAAGVEGQLPAYDVDVIDTTGSGDAFTGAVLACLLRENGIDDISPSRWDEIIRFGCAAGSLTATGYGAIPSMPSEADILRCMA